jgi:hypothetical protein
LDLTKGGEYWSKSLVIDFAKAVDVQGMSGADLARGQERAIIDTAGAEGEVGVGDVGVVRDLSSSENEGDKSEEDSE